MHIYADLITKANENLARALKGYDLADRAMERGSKMMSAQLERHADASAFASLNYFMMADNHNWAARG